VGTLGDVGFLSLGRGKPLPAMEGGVIVLPRWNDLARSLERGVQGLPAPRRAPGRLVAGALVYAALLPPERFGIAERLPFVKMGESRFSTAFGIGRLSAFQAALAAAALPQQWAVTKQRKAHAQFLLKAMKDLPHVRPVVPVEGSDPVYLRLPLRAAPAVADRVYLELQARRLGASRMYPAAVPQIPGITPHLGSGARDCPEASRLAASLVTLPTHPLVTGADLDAMVECMARAGRA
jgi:dTDP-4-amino-4,6-dideoxygalactose transaminase